MRYRNLNTNEIVEEENALDYAMQQCGIKLIDTRNSLEQEEFKNMLVEWYFSGNYIEEAEEIPDLERDLEIADIIYQENLEKKWGIA